MGKNKSYGELEVVNIRLVKEPSIIREKPISNVDDAVEVIKDFMKCFDREMFGILNLSTDGKPISFNIASIGTLDSALVSPREVFKSSILSNAAAFICFHCHPSGNVTPSLDDARTTQRLKEAGELMAINMIDHIIVGCGRGKTFSFRANDMIEGSDIVEKFERYKREKDMVR